MREPRTTDTGHVHQRDDGEAGGPGYSDEASTFYSRWEEIQARFVDEPQRSVRQANALVAEVKGRLGETLADERLKAEAQWAPPAEASTEDLREALQRYRVLFEQLLAASEQLSPPAAASSSDRASFASSGPGNKSATRM
jgi:hypothetical protein